MLKMKNILTGFISTFILTPAIYGQFLLQVDGSGILTSASGTRLDILNTNDNTNSPLRFGDNNSLKASMGFNGNNDLFVIAMSNTLGTEHFTLSQTGLLGINTLPESHRMLILHNSTSGTSGSGHLSLREDPNDFSRLRFENSSVNDHFTINARANEGSAQMNFAFMKGITNTNILTLDGEQFQVGILTQAPEAYVHIAQPGPVIDQIVFENDASGGGDRVDWRLGSDDILIYFNQGLRAAFDAADGSLNNFPLPPPPSAGPIPNAKEIIEQFNSLQPVQLKFVKSGHTMLALNPDDVESANADWVFYSEDKTKKGVNYQLLSTLALKAIAVQQSAIAQNQEKINNLRTSRNDLKARLEILEREINVLPK